MSLLVVISGPSGVGKDTVLAQLKMEKGKRAFVVTATTRPPRPYEKDGVDYIFMSVSDFRDRIKRGDFIENAEVYGHLYGVPRSQISEAMDTGMDVFLKTDVHGARTIKFQEPRALTIFLTPPSFEELVRRLNNRRTDSRQALDARMKTAMGEMKLGESFDYIVENNTNQLSKCVHTIQDIVENEKKRLSESST